jgi:branched-chain amino acid transport system ATP-binding protein
MSVKENMEMGAFPKSARGRLKESLERVMGLFPILGQRKDQPAGTLSGGEQQMLAIGRALMSRPRLLLVDKLSLGLAPMITKSIYRTLAELGTDITILLVEQNVEQALNFSRRAYILESGRMTRSGNSADLMQDADIRRAYLGM